MTYLTAVESLLILGRGGRGGRGVYRMRGSGVKRGRGREGERGRDEMRREKERGRESHILDTGCISTNPCHKQGDRACM